MAVIWRDSSALFRLSEKKYIDDMVQLTDDYPVGFLQEPENLYKYRQYKSNELFPQTKHSSKCKNYDVTVFSRYGEYFDCNPISTTFRTKFGRARSAPNVSANDNIGLERPTSSSGSSLSDKNSLDGSRCSGKINVTRLSFPQLQKKNRDNINRNNPFQNEVWYRKSHMYGKIIRTPATDVDTVDRLTMIQRLTRETASSTQKRTTFQLGKRKDNTDSKLRKPKPKTLEVSNNKFVKRKINRYDIQDMVDRLSMCSPFKRYHERISKEVS